MVSGDDGDVGFVMDPVTDQRVWGAASLGRGSLDWAPAGQGMVVFNGERGLLDLRSAESGARVWRMQLRPDWCGSAGVSLALVLMDCSHGSSYLSARRLADGSEAWNFTLTGIQPSNFVDPEVLGEANGRIHLLVRECCQDADGEYVGNQYRVETRSATTGARLWTQPIPTRDTSCYYSACIAIYIPGAVAANDYGAQGLVAFHANNGTIAWSKAIEPTSVRLTGQGLLVADHDGGVVHYDKNGNPLWSRSSPDPVVSMALDATGVLFASAADGTLRAWQT